MNLLFFTGLNPYGSGPFGGAESSTRLLAEKMAARSHRVIYLTVRATARDRALARAAGVDLRAIPRLRGGRFRIVRWLGRARWPLTIAALTLRHRIDLIYCFYELPILEAALWVRARLGRPKVVMRMAGMMWYDASIRGPALGPRYQRAFCETDSVNFISDGLVAMTEGKLAELNMPVRFRDSFVQDIGSSVPPGREIAHADLSSTPFRIVMATRFSDYQKRQDLLIRAAALLPRDLPVEITLIGNGPRLAEMQTLADDLGVTERVSFLPFLDQHALWSRMQQAHLMCHAADYEGLGKVIVEAMAKGLPVLASDVAPLNGYLREGETGFLVANSPQAWAARIAELHERRDDLARVSGAAMAFAAEQWDPERGAQAYEDRFRALVG